MHLNLVSIFATELNKFQAGALQQPDRSWSKLLLPIISFVEGLIANQPTYLDSKRRLLGSNFCCAGQVVLGEFAAIETALTSPQARTWQLGTTILDAQHLPNQDVGGRNVFLLALSDQAAGGNGDREAFRKCLQDYLLNDAAQERQRDATTARLLEELAADYLQMPHGIGGKFFTADQQGWPRFLIRYVHYVVFGLDPDAAESINLLTELHQTSTGILHYFAGIGRIFQALNIKKHKTQSDLIEKVATIYENSPALANFQPNNSSPNPMTRREVAKLMTAVFSIAAIVGPLFLGQTAMGYSPLPAYQGQQTAQIDPTKYWDALDLHDREAVKLYLLECARLWAPVSATHRVATTSFTANIAGSECTFPPGTKILIPMSLGLLDQSFWGATTYEFHANRENLCPFHMGFNSVGDRSAGRICPGKDIALDMLIDVIRVVGEARRSIG
jgi:hypothetical protein